MEASGTSGGVILQGQTNHALSTTTNIASCALDATQLRCVVKSLADTLFYAAAKVPLAAKVVLVGQYNVRTSIAIYDAVTATTVLNTYTASNVRSLQLTRVASPLHFFGAFVAGTSVRGTAVGSIGIVLGMVRTDQGLLSAMSMAPVNGDIMDGWDLVTATTIENTQPDSFVVGGLEVSEGSAGKHAYLLRANGLFMSVNYCMRYRARAAGKNVSSVMRGIVLVDTTLYAIVDVAMTHHNTSALTVMTIQATSGAILGQVHIAAPNASLSCTDLAASATNLIFACSTTSSNGSQRSVLLFTNMELAFNNLPLGWKIETEDLFQAEIVPFQRSVLAVTM